MLPLLALAATLCVDPLTQTALEAQGRVGAAAAVIEGTSILEFHAAEHFPMQSVYKLPIGMAILNAVDRGALKLDRKIHVNKSEYVSKAQHSPLRDSNPDGADASVVQLLRLAVLESDGSASDVLLRLIGGPATVMRFLASIGVRAINIRDTEMRLGHDDSVQYRNWATPKAAVDLLRAVHESRGLAPPSHALLLRLMTGTTTFPRIAGLLPSGTPVVHKTGSSGTRDGIAAATNDIGIVTLPNGRHLAIAVFVSDSKADDGARDRVIAEIAREAWNRAAR